MGSKNPSADWAQFFGGRDPRRNHAIQIWWRSVQRFWVGWGLNFAFSHILWRSSLQHSHYHVRCDVFIVSARQSAIARKHEMKKMKAKQRIYNLLCLPFWGARWFCGSFLKLPAAVLSACVNGASTRVSNKQLIFWIYLQLALGSQL